MSDLILPHQNENPLLKANLHAFFQRYPHERSRLEVLLSKPVDKQPVAQIELPAVPSKPPLRVCILAGIGSPLFLEKFFNDSTVREEMFQAFIVDNNIEFLRFLFQHFNIVPFIQYNKLEWLLMQNEESIKPGFFRVLKREHVASMMRNVYVLESSVPQPLECSQFYQKLPKIYDETSFHVMHNFGRINDSLDGIRATLLNKDVILSNPGIDQIKDLYKGLPALIVGAGPSLDAELDTIKANNNKFVVIAADAALKPLIKHGIRVDFCTSIERLNNFQKPFFEGLGPINTELVAFPVLHPDQFPLYPGPIRLVYRNYSYYAYFEKSWPKGIIKCGGSTSHLGMRLAAWLGCTKALMIGLDSCYEEKDGLYRSHCSNTGHKDWGDYIPLEDFFNKRRHLPPIQAVNNLGEISQTNLTYYQWVKEYSEELAEIGLQMQIINCAPKGLRMEGIPFAKLTDVVKSLDDVSFPAIPKRETRYERHFKHKEIMENFKHWTTMFSEVIQECDRLISLETITDEAYDALIHVYFFKIAIDSLFVAFVVQCCAKEFFELENKWWSYSKNPHIEQKEKIAVIKEKIILFKTVMDQIIQIFEENKDGKTQQVYKSTDSGLFEE